MNDAPALLVVCDAGPLIHLDELNCLDLLADFSRAVVPDVVWREVELHRPTVLDQKTISLARLKPREEPSPELRSLHRLLALHSGELQALQLLGFYFGVYPVATAPGTDSALRLLHRSRCAPNAGEGARAPSINASRTNPIGHRSGFCKAPSLTVGLLPQ
jgi:hypothetical protein